MSARIFLPAKIARRLPWQAGWLFTFLTWDIRPLRRYQSRIAFLEASIAEHERKLTSLFRIMTAVYEAEGIPVPADLGGPERFSHHEKTSRALHSVPQKTDRGTIGFQGGAAS
jgi:hypothetical protein